MNICLKIVILINFRGSAIAKIVGANAKALANFDDRVTMYVYEEMIDGKKLTEIINETHENVKYLPGKKLPPNVVSIRIYQFWLHFINVLSFVNMASFIAHKYVHIKLL